MRKMSGIIIKLSLFAIILFQYNKSFSQKDACDKLVTYSKDSLKNEQIIRSRYCVYSYGITTSYCIAFQFQGSDLNIIFSSSDKDIIEKSQEIEIFFENGKTLLFKFSNPPTSEYIGTTLLCYLNSERMTVRELKLFYESKVTTIKQHKTNSVFNLNDKRTSKFIDVAKCFYDKIQPNINSINKSHPFVIRLLKGNDIYNGVTRIEYKSLDQILNEVEKQSVNQMWTDQKKQSVINDYKNNYLGGNIILYIERITIESANTNMFTIIVKDKNETELTRCELEGRIPEIPIGEINWWNYGGCNISQKVEIPFYIYIVDKLGKEPFKFMVEEVLK